MNITYIRRANSNSDEFFYGVLGPLAQVTTFSVYIWPEFVFLNNHSINCRLNLYEHNF